jgi:hypothetical protein
MSERHAPDVYEMSPAMLDELITLNATADAEDAVNTMLEAIRTQQATAREAVESAAASHQNPEHARALLDHAKEAADWMTTNASTFEQLHRTAFTRGALWMMQAISRGTK